MLPVDESAFRDYVADRRRPMARTAFLLTGDWRTAEGLVRESLAKLYVAWTKVQQRDDSDLYAHRILFSTYLDSLRKPWRRSIAVAHGPSGDPARDDPALDGSTPSESPSRRALRTALQSVPPKQRAVLVLRFWEGRSAEQTADLLNCSVNAVNSRAEKGLSHLDDALARSSLGTIRGTG